LQIVKASPTKTKSGSLTAIRIKRGWVRDDSPRRVGTMPKAKSRFLVAMGSSE
jgi:hypothetical protein